MKMKGIKKSKRLAAVLLAGVMLLSAAPVPEVQAAGKVKSVTVTNLPGNTLVLKKGASKTLKVKVLSNTKKAVSQKVTYKSANTKVVKVTSKGKVTAVKKGSAKVTITSVADKSKKLTVTVKVGIPVKKVSVDKKNMELAIGETYKLQTSVSPKNATVKSLVYSSDNEKVATVSSKGKIKAKKQGTAKITVEAKDGSGKKAVVTVKVSEKTTEAQTTTEAPTTTETPATTADPTTTETPTTEPITSEEEPTTSSEEPTTEKQMVPYIQYLDFSDGNLAFWDCAVRQTDKYDHYELRFKAGEDLDDCREYITVQLKEAYADSYAYEFVWNDTYDSLSAFEKGTGYRTAGALNIYKKDDAQKKTVASYEFNYLRYYDCFEDIESPRIIRVNWDRSPELGIYIQAFSDWRTNIPESLSTVEDLISLTPGYTCKVDFDAPKGEDSKEYWDYKHAAFIYFYADTDEEQKNPLTAYELCCEIVPEFFNPEDLTVTRLLVDYKDSSINLWVNDNITKDNIEEIKEKLKFGIDEDVYDIAYDIDWDGYDDDTKMLLGRITVTKKQPENEYEAMPDEYSLEVRDECYITDIQVTKTPEDGQRGITEWDETFAIELTGNVDFSEWKEDATLTGSGYQSNQEAYDNNINDLLNCITILDGYYAKFRYDGGASGTWTGYKLDIYDAETKKVVCTKSMSYQHLGY